MLSDAEQMAILATLERPGWTIANAAAVPVTRLGQDARLQSVNIPTGEYTILLKDPSGQFQPAKIRQGGALPDGTPKWVASDAPDTYPKPVKTEDRQVVTFADGSRMEAQGTKPDGTTNWVQIGAPNISNPDTDRSTALKAQSDQELINRRRVNEAAGRGYITDDDWITFQQNGEKLGQSQQEINLARDKFNQQKLNEDAKRQPEIDQILAETGRIGAQTGLASAQANQVTGAAEIAASKAPGEIEENAARTDLAKAQAAQARQATDIAKAPTTADVGTGQYIYQQNPLTGDLKSSLNLNAAQPKTAADISARMGQLQSLAQAKKQELSARSLKDPNFTAEQALSEWNTWWDANVESQKGALEAAQVEAQAQRARDDAAMRTSAYTAAQAGGTQAINAYNAQAPRRVGPGAAEAAQGLMSGKPMSQVDMKSAMFYDAPNLQDQASQATMDALKYISPTAAQATGTGLPDYRSVDIAGGLNRMNYQPGGGAAAPPMQAAPAMQTGAPPAQQGVPPEAAGPAGWAAMFQRLQADREAQKFQSTYAYPG